MILRLLAASLRRRCAQLALVFVAVATAAGTVSALAGFAARALGAGDGLGGELAAFGPNLTVRPQVGAPPLLPAAEVDRVQRVSGVESATGVLDTDAAVSATATAAGAYPVTADRGPAPGVDRIDVRADRRRLAEVAAAIESAVPGVEARPLLRVSESEAALARRLTWLLAAVSAVSCLLAAITVAAATAALVDQRRSEYAVFLALGFTGRRTAAIFAAELLTVAVAAGLAGAVTGELAAVALASRLLGGGTATLAGLPWSGPAAAVAAVAVVAAAISFALRRIGRLEPARVLRGE